MTVAELIEQLQAEDPTWVIVVTGSREEEVECTKIESGFCKRVPKQSRLGNHANIVSYSQEREDLSITYYEKFYGVPSSSSQSALRLY